MKNKRFSVEQIMGVQKQAQVGVPVAEVIRKVGISGRVHSRYTRRLGDLPWDGSRFAFCCQPGSSSARAMDAGDASSRSRFQASHHDMPGGLFGQLRL